MSALLNEKYPPLSPYQEFLAYEALWEKPESTFRTIFEQLQDSPFASALAGNIDIESYKKRLASVLENVNDFGIRIYGDGEYPSKLNDARYPLRIFYYQGDWQLTYLPSIAVVGTRQPTPEGERITQTLVKKLVQDKFVIVSGLARGVDTIAHKTAIENKGSTIAVIGTPLNHSYPPENRHLQDIIASEHLLISQVPFLRYASQNFLKNKLFFPERNITMSALSDATIIVEAGETSGTLTQARAALHQNRKLLILDNNFRNPSLTWPRTYEKKGAIRIHNYDELKTHLSSISPKDR